jgi:hypothetical protein
VCCPEMNIGMLFIGCMREDEVVNVRNCRRFAAYAGYLHTFHCTGSAAGAPLADVLTIDACMQRHFSAENVLRDTRKAYTSFAALASVPPVSALPGSRKRPVTAAATPSVSTGRWGCGVFGGTPAHKFAEQMCAAGLAGVSLQFSNRHAGEKRITPRHIHATPMPDPCHTHVTPTPHPRHTPRGQPTPHLTPHLACAKNDRALFAFRCGSVCWSAIQEPSLGSRLRSIYPCRCLRVVHGMVSRQKRHASFHASRFCY